jgi:hypothetical protein
VNVSAHACMIVGLKYVGEADDRPTRVLIGDVVKLRREPREQPDPRAVTAFYKGRKVGYLSPEKQALWDSLRPSARRRAKVTGEILDEDGDLAGLDVQIGVECDKRSPVTESAVAVKSTRMNGLGIVIGFAVLSLILTAGADSTDRAIPAFGSMMPDPLALIDQPPRHQTELVKYQDRTLRAEVARALPQADTHRTQKLAEDLRQARVVAAQQGIRIDELERQTRATAAHWQAKNHKLEGDIAEMQQRIERMTLIAQQRENEEKNAIALSELNREELMRHKNQIAAWAVAARKLAQATKKTRSAVQPPNEQASAPSVIPIEKTTKIQKKTNFSRYAQEYRDWNRQQPPRFAR